MHTTLNYFTQILSVVIQFGITEADCLKAAELDVIPETDRVKADISSKVLKFAAERLEDPLIGIKCGIKYPFLQYTRPGEILKICENTM